ncbi:D-proline reductase (dithiol) proprotein PrdA [Azotosporobacter soli]|uniref:D-proline reductase (dithiol) proprotein PrdA n=1 Tax=Azotosporobacter soli TaxID=3055040 RepID=UPI0031FEB7CA
MSITKETAAEHKNDPAVVCCLTTAGTVISPADLEDPGIFPDLEDSGLLTLPANVAKIGQVIGAKLTKTVDALTPLTGEFLEGMQEMAGEAPAAKVKAAPETSAPQVQQPAAATMSSGGMIRIHIEEGKGINLEFPAVVMSGNAPAASASQAALAPETAVVKTENKVLRTLIEREYKVNKVQLGDATAFENGVLTIRKALCQEALKADPLVKKIELDIVTPDNQHIYTPTIMDVIPMATKVEGELGEGVSHSLVGVVVLLTGVDESGMQVHEFGSCEGYMDEKIRYDRPGCPDKADIIVRVMTTIQAGTGMERRGPFAAHKACDTIIQEIREVLKKLPAEGAVETKEYQDIRKLGRPRVVLVKEIMGQGAMHDNVILPSEPAGIMGGRPNVDLGNVPVVLSANEVRDGGVHALTCIGPASKENTRHYFREPLVDLMAKDEEIDLVGVVFVGSPQINDEKMYVSGRIGAIVEALGVEGAIVTTEGFGNNHIDFASHIEQIGKRGVAVVGVTYSAYQGALVVGNKYMNSMIDLNKNDRGFESEILGDNTLCPWDAERALLMLKTKMAGVEIKGPGRKWEQSVIEGNQKLVDAALK